MRRFSVFDILGPIMIGPSSSHTAGAARLGKIAKTIAGGNIVEAEFLLHGSFAKTYKGHGTDKALVAGILGMEPCDERLRNSFEIAEEENLKFKFTECDLGDVHPNTVKFILTMEDGSVVNVTGSSIGGGNIMIKEVNGESVEFSGAYPTLIINHVDLPGVVSRVTTLLYEKNINIAFMKVYRNRKGADATMVFEMDNIICDDVVEKIESIVNVESVTVINPIVEAK